jgi:hypothetical protein
MLRCDEASWRGIFETIIRVVCGHHNMFRIVIKEGAAIYGVEVWQYHICSRIIIHTCVYVSSGARRSRPSQVCTLVLLSANELSLPSKELCAPGDSHRCRRSREGSRRGRSCSSGTRRHCDRRSRPGERSSARDNVVVLLSFHCFCAAAAVGCAAAAGRSRR